MRESWPAPVTKPACVITPRRSRSKLYWPGAPRPPAPPSSAALLRGDAKVTLSKLESAFLVLLGNEGLPLPETNRPAGGRRVDCRWPELKLTVELDSYRYHHSRHAWENDRRREREAYARGDGFRRYTYGDVLETPQPMLAELRALLTAAKPTPARAPR